MKTKLKLCVIMSIMLTLLTFVFNANVFATDVENNIDNTEVEAISSEESNELTTLENEVYEGDLYVLFSEDNNYNATTYVMDKYVDGNVFIFGQDVTITGQVNGSLFVFSSTLTIEEEAYVGCHIFAFADTIKMAGSTYDMYVAGNSIHITPQGVIYRDLKAAAESLYLFGSIGRDADIMGNDIIAYEDSNHVLNVGGDLNYNSGKAIENIDNITVHGDINYTESQEETETEENVVMSYIYDGIENVVFTLIIYMLLMFLAPKFIEKSREYASTRALLSVAVGTAFTILVPIVAIALLFTVIGIGISLTSIMIYSAILMLNCAITTIIINEFATNKLMKMNETWKRVLMIIPVSIILFALRQIPYGIGAILSIIIFLVGVGTIILYQFDKRKKEE